MADDPPPERAAEEGDEAAAVVDNSVLVGVEAARVVDNRVLVGVELVDVVVLTPEPEPEPEPEPDPETPMLPSRNGRKGNGVVLKFIWAGDRSGLLRIVQRGRPLEDECSVMLEMELVTPMGRSVMV